MKFKLLHVCTLLSLALIGSHAVSPETYWKSVLPNSPMPKAIKDLLYTKAWYDGKEQASTYTTSKYIKLKGNPTLPFWNVVSQEAKVNLFPLKGNPTLPFWNVASKEVKVNLFPLYHGDEVKVNHIPLDHGASRNQLSKNQLTDNLLAKSLFFLRKDLHQGEEMKLHFMMNDQKNAFLPKNISDSIPFSSKDLPQIYNKFSVKPNSMDDEIMKETLSVCENEGNKGEGKFCATSLESMVDFSTTKLGKKVKALSTEVSTTNITPSQKYKVELVQKLATNKVMVCHRLDYAYAVFFCHISHVGTESYVVSLEGADGTKMKSATVCHTDTSKWDPKYIVFQLLKVTPGTAPICHILPEDTVLWVPYD